MVFFCLSNFFWPKINVSNTFCEFSDTFDQQLSACLYDFLLKLIGYFLDFAQRIFLDRVMLPHCLVVSEGNDNQAIVRNLKELFCLWAQPFCFILLFPWDFITFVFISLIFFFLFWGRINFFNWRRTENQVIFAHSYHQAALSKVVFHNEYFISLNQYNSIIASDLPQGLENFLLTAFTVK